MNKDYLKTKVSLIQSKVELLKIKAQHELFYSVLSAKDRTEILDAIELINLALIENEDSVV